jgi:hypothetical protein
MAMRDLSIFIMLSHRTLENESQKFMLPIIARRVKNAANGIVNYLFGMREVEVTIEQRGNKFSYTYRKLSSKP